VDVGASVKRDSLTGYRVNEGASDHLVGVSRIYPLLSRKREGVAPSICILKRGVARGVAPPAGVKSHLFRLGVSPIGVIPAAIFVAVLLGVSHFVDVLTV